MRSEGSANLVPTIVRLRSSSITTNISAGLFASATVPMAHSSTQPVAVDIGDHHHDTFVTIEETSTSPSSSDGSVSLADWSSVSDPNAQEPQPRPSTGSTGTPAHPIPDMQALTDATEALVIGPLRSNDERQRESEDLLTDDLSSSIVFATPRSDLADSMTLPDSADRRSNAAPETQPVPYPYPASSPASLYMSRQSTASVPPLSGTASTAVDTSLSTVVATPVNTKANPLVVNTETPRVAQRCGGDSPVEHRRRQSPLLHRSPSSNSALSYLTQPVTSRDRTSFAAPQSFSNPSFLATAPPPPRIMTPDHIADFGGSLSESRRTGGRVDDRRFSPLHSELEQDMREWFQPDRALSPEAHVRFDDLFGGDWPADPYERAYSNFTFTSQATSGSASQPPHPQPRANPTNGTPLAQKRFSASSPTESEASSTYQRASWNRTRSSGLTVASMMTSDTPSPGVQTRSARLTLTPSPAPTDSMSSPYPSTIPQPVNLLDQQRATRSSWAETSGARDMRARCYTPTSDGSSWEPREVSSSPAPPFHVATGSIDMRPDESPRSKRPLPDVPGGLWGSPEPPRERQAGLRPRSPMLLSIPWSPPTYVPAGTSLFDTNDQPATRQERHSRAPLPPVPSVQPIPLPPQSSAMQQPTTLHRRFSDFPYPTRPASLSNQANWPASPFVASAYPSYPPHYPVQDNQPSFNTSSYNIPPQLPNPRASMSQPYSLPQSYPQPLCQQHPKFWFADGTLAFLVEDTEVRVHRHFFEVHSSVFKSVLANHTAMLNTGSCGPLVYNLNWEKIKLVDFERLLAIFYPKFVVLSKIYELLLTFV